MTLSDLASIGSFISGIAVLISLIYLSFQIRQNTLSQHATARQHVQGFMRQHQKLLMDPGLASIFLRGLNGQEGMTEVELMQYHAMVRDWISFHEESKWLGARGMLDSEARSSADGGLRVMLRYPGFRAAWRLSRYVASRAYGDFVAAELAIALSKSVPPTYVDSWQAAIAAEHATITNATS